MAPSEVTPVEFVENCQVEWDKRRGVLYVHNKDTGATVVRVSGLPKVKAKCSLSRGQIDVRADFSTMPPKD